jgi:hypothetical protein
MKMSEFSTDSFSDPIRLMSDGALSRLAAIESGDIDSMRAGDTYFNTIRERRDTNHFREVSFDTFKQAFVIDNIADSLIQQDSLAEHLMGILSGMLLALTDAHDMKQQRSVTPMALDTYQAHRLIADAWLFSTTHRQQHEEFSLYSAEIGSVAVTSILLSPLDMGNAWSLGYQTTVPKVTYWAQESLGEIEEVVK